MRGPFFVYILANRPRGALYVGVTNDLLGRVGQHRALQVDGHTKRYKIVKLVHFEVWDRIDDAIRREKQLKRWRRAWKLDLIETGNAGWNDLWYELTEPENP